MLSTPISKSTAMSSILSTVNSEVLAKPLRKWTEQSQSLPKCRSRATFAQIREDRASSRLGFAIPSAVTSPVTTISLSCIRTQNGARGRMDGNSNRTRRHHAASIRVSVRFDGCATDALRLAHVIPQNPLNTKNYITLSQLHTIRIYRMEPVAKPFKWQTNIDCFRRLETGRRGVSEAF